MAENNSFTVQYNLADLVKEMAGLKIAMTVAVCVGTAAIVAGSVVSWFVITTQLETNRTIGELQGERSVVVILEDIQKTLKGLSPERKTPDVAPAPEKQGSLENLPLQMEKWTGVKADSADKLANALLKTPTKSPVIVYTDDADAAAAIKSMIDAEN